MELINMRTVPKVLKVACTPGSRGPRGPRPSLTGELGRGSKVPFCLLVWVAGGPWTGGLRTLDVWR